MSTPITALVAFAVWTITLLILGVGVHRWLLILRGQAELRSFPGDEPHGPPFYRRVVRAHANCIENLPVFGALVLAVHATGLSSPVVDALCVTVVAARVGQSLAHISSGANAAIAVRFSFLCVQLFCFLWIVAILFGAWRN